MNKAFIMKLGWGIIHDNCNFQVEVLRGKYFKKKDCAPHVQAKGMDSPL